MEVIFPCIQNVVKSYMQITISIVTKLGTRLVTILKFLYDSIEIKIFFFLFV